MVIKCQYLRYLRIGNNLFQVFQCYVESSLALMSFYFSIGFNLFCHLEVPEELEVLKEASPPKPRELSSEESKNLLDKEEATFRELRLFLRQVTWKLLADRKFKEFSKPVDLEEVS